MSTLPDEVHGRLLDTLSWIGRLRESLPGGGRGRGLRGLLRDMMILELYLVARQIVNLEKLVEAA